MPRRLLMKFLKTLKTIKESPFAAQELVRDPQSFRDLIVIIGISIAANKCKGVSYIFDNL